MASARRLPSKRATACWWTKFAAARVLTRIATSAFILDWVQLQRLSGCKFAGPAEWWNALKIWLWIPSTRRKKGVECARKRSDGRAFEINGKGGRKRSPQTATSFIFG